MAVAMLGLTVVVADLGTALVPILTAVAVFWVAGLERRYVCRVAMIGLAFVVLAVVSRGYRVGRIIAYVDPDYHKIETIDRWGLIRAYVENSSAVRDGGYQSRQSKIAVGAGGVLGVGLMQGKQKLMFLPDAHTDFIYEIG